MSIEYLVNDGQLICTECNWTQGVDDELSVTELRAIGDAHVCEYDQLGDLYQRIFWRMEQVKDAQQKYVLAKDYQQASNMQLIVETYETVMAMITQMGFNSDF